MKKYHIEICTNSVASCIAAEQGGADRVELCAAIPEGGTTPSYGTIKLARKQIKIGLHVIIRPRGGDFLYSPDEIEMMLTDIEIARQLGADGVVFGCLTPEGTVDIPVMKRLMGASKGLSVTFHRTFDVTADPMEALESLVDLGCNRILTSGASSTAEQGIPLLTKLVQQAGGRIIIMPGSGITENNIAEIAEKTGANEFHFSARSTYPSLMKFRNQHVSMGGTVTIDEYSQNITDAAKVETIIDRLNKTK